MGARTINILTIPFLAKSSLFILLCLYTTRASSYSESCGPSVNFAGYTRPKGDIYVEYGKPLEINCTVNNIERYDEAPNLYFEVGTARFPEDKIEILNRSTIRLYDPNPQLQSSLYHCKLDTPSYRSGEIACLNKVIVGTKPAKVRDFKCISKNWDNLTCTWLNEPNNARVTYSLTYKFKPARRSETYSCPKIEVVGNEVKCFWSTRTTPLYRTAQNYFNFTIEANNSFGTTITTKKFIHYENVQPNKPPSVNYSDVGINSVDLEWEVPQTMVAFPKPLQHKIMHLCTFDEEKDWKYNIIYSNDKKYVRYKLLDLEHAYDRCDIRIAIRVNDSTSEEMWSQNTSLIIRTLGTVPEMPPKTSTGSFQLLDVGNDINTREAFVYWQQIPEKFKNGKDFNYRIEIVSERFANETLILKTNAYAKFVNLNKNKNYKFAIWSENINGTSLEKSYVTIARDGDRPKPPRVDPKIDYRDGTYELSWNATGTIDNYTIFWCTHDRDRPFQCQGMLNWTVVPSLLSSHNVTVKEDSKVVIQFAIAANGPKGSSGMVWVPCTVIHDEMQGKIHHVIVNKVGSRFIELRWMIKCADGIGTVKGFIIYYCTTLQLKSQCDGPQQNITIEGGKDHAIVGNLKPYTTYKMTLAVISKRGTYSEQSEPLYNTTLEDAPNQIQFNEEKEQVSIHSIHVEWNAPNTTNGVITAYELSLASPKSNHPQIFNVTPEYNNTRFEHTFINLNGFTNYTIEVKACTTSCSKATTKHITTKVGIPTKIEKVSVQYENKEYLLIWDPPTHLNGPLIYYEVEVQRSEDGVNTEPINLHASARDKTVINSYCSSDQDKEKNENLYIKVRAVNHFNNSNYEGDWSQELTFNCQQTAQYLLWIWIIVSLIFVMLVCYVVKKGYSHCMEMTDVQVKLPAGLQLQLPPVIEGFTTWNVPNSPEEPPRKPPPADEEHLLEKLSDGRSGDSSGCSSGHDSVTSLESGNNVSSSSDSGTEQPPSPDETNFLRKRKVDGAISTSKPYVSADAVPNWKPNPLPPASGNYCVLGVNPINVQKEPETTYVPIVQSIVPAPSKGYVTCPATGIPSQSWNPKSPPPAGNYCMLGLNPETSTKGYVAADAFQNK